MKTIHAVTGAFGYSGKYIAQELLNQNKQVITLTNSYKRHNPFGDKVKAFPFNFDNKQKIIENLKEVKVLYNTYWVRFNHKNFTHADAVKNTKLMFEAAKEAGVEKIVHVSITNPRLDSQLEYFSGKAELEEALKKTGISYSILRPTVIFGKEDILINNIAWVLRKFPFIAVFGNGEYKIQPIYVMDLAKLAIRESENTENVIIDAIGPETFTYNELIDTIGEIIGVKRNKKHVSDNMGYFLGRIISSFVGDVLITREEIDGLKSNLLYTQSPPAANKKLTDWIKEHKDVLGKKYSNELSRRKDKQKDYDELRTN